MFMRVGGLSLLLSFLAVYSARADVVLANTSSFNGNYVGDFNIKYGTTNLADAQAVKTLKLFGNTGQTITASIGYYPNTGVNLTGIEIGTTGEYLFDISSATVSTYTANSYALEIRNMVASGFGIQKASSGTATYAASGYSLITYDVANVRFELSTTAVPEPGTLLLGGIAAACGGSGVWWKRRRRSSSVAT